MKNRLKIIAIGLILTGASHSPARAQEELAGKPLAQASDDADALAARTKALLGRIAPAFAVDAPGYNQNDTSYLTPEKKACLSNQEARFVEFYRRPLNQAVLKVLGLKTVVIDLEDDARPPDPEFLAKWRGYETRLKKGNAISYESQAHYESYAWGYDKDGTKLYITLKVREGVLHFPLYMYRGADALRCDLATADQLEEAFYGKLIHHDEDFADVVKTLGNNISPKTILEIIYKKSGSEPQPRTYISPAGKIASSIPSQQ